MTPQAKHTLATWCFFLALATFFALAPQWALAVAQLFLWPLGVLLLICGLAGQGGFIKRHARELVARLDDHNDRPVRRAVGRLLWVCVVMAMAAAGFPGLAALYLALLLHITWCQHMALVLVRRLDDDAKRQLDEYEQATEHPV